MDTSFEMQKSFVCPICDKGFRQRGNLTRHLKIHSVHKQKRPLDEMYSSSKRLRLDENVEAVMNIPSNNISDLLENSPAVEPVNVVNMSKLETDSSSLLDTSFEDITPLLDEFFNELNAQKEIPLISIPDDDSYTPKDFLEDFCKDLINQNTDLINKPTDITPLCNELSSNKNLFPDLQSKELNSQNGDLVNSSSHITYHSNEHPNNTNYVFEDFQSKDLNFQNGILTNASVDINPLRNELTSNKTSLFEKLQNSYHTCKVLFQKELCDLVNLSLKLCDSEFKICINYNVSKLSSPGISMDVFTWYEFCKKIKNLNNVSTPSSFLANNNILVLNINSEIQIQNLKSCLPTKMKLKESELTILKQEIPAFNELILDFIYTDYISYLMKQEGRVVKQSSTSENFMFSNLVIWLEHECISLMKRFFECDACKNCRFNILKHTCLTLSNHERYTQLGMDVLLLPNIAVVVKNFLDHIEFVTEDFLSNLNVRMLHNVLFKYKV